MPTNTPNFNLIKPLKSENYNVDQFNTNADIIDSELFNIGVRVDDILTTPVPTGEVIAQEIIDARQGEASLGANITKIRLEKSYVLKSNDNLQTILNSGIKNIELNPTISYSFNNILLPSGTFIVGKGATITSPNTTYAIFNTNGNDDINISGINFVGATASPDGVASVASDVGIKIDTSYRVRVQDCEFNNFLGCGINAHGLPIDLPAAIANKSIRNIITKNRFSKCFIGLALWDQSEYGIISDNNFTYCRVAIWSQSGNCAFTGNCIANCRAGFVSTPDINNIILSSGDNRQHGSVVGNIFNHCRSDQSNIPWTTNFLINGKDYQGVWIDGLAGTLPPSFVANTMYYSDLKYLNADVSAMPIWVISGCVFSRMEVSCSHNGYLQLNGCTAVTLVTYDKVLKSGLNATVVRKTVAQSLATGVPATMNWGEALYGDHWSVSNPTRLTVPTGATKVRVTAQGAFASNSTGQRQYEILMNGGYPQGRGANYLAPNPAASTVTTAQSAIVNVVPGDYFEVVAFQNSGGSLNVLASTTTWFMLEVIE